MTGMQPQQRSATPDAKNMRQQAGPYNAPPNPNYMPQQQQQQQQQQQRMAYNQPVQGVQPMNAGGPNGQMNQNQMGWQQQQQLQSDSDQL